MKIILKRRKPNHNSIFQGKYKIPAKRRSHGNNFHRVYFYHPPWFYTLYNIKYIIRKNNEMELFYANFYVYLFVCLGFMVYQLLWVI